MLQFFYWCPLVQVMAKFESNLNGEIWRQGDKTTQKPLAMFDGNKIVAEKYFTPSLKICQYPTVFVQNWILSWKRKIFDKINPTFLVFHQNFPFNVYLFSEVWHLCNYSKRWQIYIWDPDISFKISIIVQYLKIYQLRIFEWDESITKGVEFSKVSNI